MKNEMEKHNNNITYNNNTQETLYNTIIRIPLCILYNTTL